MEGRNAERLADSELRSLFDSLFPNGFAGQDVLAEIAPEGWERSPLVACFHPSVERVFEEEVRMHRHLESLPWMEAPRGGQTRTALPEPTLADVQREYKRSPVNQAEEVTELVGMCLWDTFSDNHEVIMADGRCADIGPFRGASAFLDEYLTRGHYGWCDGDDMRFYMGSIFVSARADLTPVYTMIFRRLQAAGADWIYHFPELGIVDLAPIQDERERVKRGYSVEDGARAELDAQLHRAEVDRLRGELAEDNTRAREEAMDQPPPSSFGRIEVCTAGTLRAGLRRDAYLLDARGLVLEAVFRSMDT
jgi:hypothetical protein